MAIEVNGELVLDRDETVAFIRNMIHPDLEAIRRRDAFLREMEDISFSFTEDGIIAESNRINIRDEKQPIYDSQRIVPSRQGNVTFEHQSPGYDYPFDARPSHFSAIKKDEGWWTSSRFYSMSIVRAA